MTREILFFDPAIHSKLGQDRHHLSCRARLRPSCIVLVSFHREQDSTPCNHVPHGFGKDHSSVLW